MENFDAFIDYIARTNLFNFAIFLSIIVFLIKKMNISGKLEEAQVGVKNAIVESEATLVQSVERLSSIEESLSHIEDDIEEILSKSEENARLVGERIILDANNTALTIRENTGKAIENSRMILKNELLKRASLASVEVARAHIINELSWNQGLHDKLIDESLETMGGLDL